MHEDRLEVQPIDGEAMAEIELLAKLILIASAADRCCQQSIDIALGGKGQGLPDEKLGA
jgi:hypothetical protein